MARYANQRLDVYKGDGPEKKKTPAAGQTAAEEKNDDPEQPRGLGPAGRAFWRRQAAAMRRDNVWSQQYQEMLRMIALEHDALVTAGNELRKRPLITITINGHEREVENPARKTVKSLGDNLRWFLMQVGQTPATRSRLEEQPLLPNINLTDDDDIAQHFA